MMKEVLPLRLRFNISSVRNVNEKEKGHVLERPTLDK